MFKLNYSIKLHIKTKVFIKHKSTSIKSNLKAFNEIPTLKSFPLIGHSYLFLPGGGYKSERLTEAVIDLNKKLGPIFRLKLGGQNLVITVNAEHTELLFRNEGKYPMRPSFPALIQYRKQTFNSIGVVPGNGSEWHKYRSGVNPLLQTKLVQAYAEKHKNVANCFIEYIENNKNSNDVVSDMFQHLLKFTIEAISVTCPGYRFQCFKKTNDETMEIINASVEFMEGLYKTLIELPIWKIYKNTAYRKLEKSHSVIHRIIKKHLESMKRNYNDNPKIFLECQPFMFHLFNNKNLSWDDITMLAMEVFLGGIDATATTTAFTLLYLAKNKQIQEIAREECLKTDTNLPFLRACIKETLRLSPTSGANARFLFNDTKIDDYYIPAGTLLSAFFSVTSLNESYFNNSKAYHPQRWLRNVGNEIHPFASLPFGYGPRMCPGKRLAEQEILLLLQSILKSYKLETDGNPNVGMIYRMNRIPDGPINIKFVNTNL